MNFIILVLKDFYECCNMPVKAISSEFDDIYKIGYNDYFEEIFPLEQIKDLINHSGSHLDINLDSNICLLYTSMLDSPYKLYSLNFYICHFQMILFYFQLFAYYQIHYYILYLIY